MGVYHYPIIKQWIAGLPQIPYRNGVGAYEGVVMHYTANDRSNADGEASYASRNWPNAFPHEFIDPNEIIQIANYQYGAYGAGQFANQRFVHLELCVAKTQAEFDQSFDMWCERAAEYLAARKLGVSPAQPDDSGTLWSHAEVSKYLGGTDHTDPIEYLKRWGKTWQDVIDRVTAYYDGLVTEYYGSKPIPTPPKPVSKTPIIGKAAATVEQMRAYLRSINPDAPDYAQLYLDLGAKYGIRGDLAFCQAIKETGAWRFGGQVHRSQNNFAGLGATNDGAEGASFATPADGIEAQMQHLFAYATTGNLPGGVTCIDPRFDLVKRGIAPSWEDLNGRWAVPSTTYGQDVVKMWRDMCAIQIRERSELEISIDWAKSNSIILGNGEDFGADQPITRGQLAVILHRYSEKFSK